MAHEAMAEQLSRLGWRVGDQPPLPIDSRWADIIGVILKYQQEHSGRTPFNPVIAQATGMSPGQVQHHLQQMMERGFITETARHGGLVVMASAVQAAQAEPKAAPAAPEEEEETMATVEVPTPSKMPSGKKRRESFLVNAKRFAQVLTDYYDQHGHAPMIKDIAAELGYRGTKPVGVSRVVKEMVQRGWLHHKSGCHGDFVLTGLGRAVLFGEPLREDVHTDMPVRPQPTKRFEPSPHWPHPQMEVRRAAPPPESPVVVRPARAQPSGWGEQSPVMRVYQPPKPVEPTPVASLLSTVDSVDLVLELQARGFRVSR